MKASEYIKKLQLLIDYNGDFDCFVESDYDGRISEAKGPEVKTKLILNNREKIQRYSDHFLVKNGLVRQGDKVINIG